jgi:hypothetical protein
MTIAAIWSMGPRYGASGRVSVSVIT